MHGGAHAHSVLTHFFAHTCSDTNATPHPCSRHFFAQGYTREPGVISLPCESHFLLPRAINDTAESETLAPKWLPIWNGGVTSP